MTQSYIELVCDLIKKFGTSYQTDKEIGISQTQLLKYEKGTAGRDTFTAHMISRLLAYYSEAQVANAIFESVKRWEKEEDAKATIRERERPKKRK